MYGPYLIEKSQGFGIEHICNDRSVDEERYYSRYDSGIDFMIIFRKDVLCVKKISNELHLIHLFQTDIPSLKITMVSLYWAIFKEEISKLDCPKGFEVLIME